MNKSIKQILTPYYFRNRIPVSPVSFYKYYKGEQLNSITQKFAASLSFFKPIASPEKQQGIVLMQMVKDYEYTIKLAAASKALADKNNYLVQFYDVDWMYRIGWGSKYRAVYEKLFKSKYEQIYSHLDAEIVFGCGDKWEDEKFITQKLAEIIAQIKKPEDILSVKIEQVLVGDLIYDTYLRYYHQPTIEAMNKDIEKVIELSLHLFYNFSSYLKTTKIVALVNTYSSYIEHGITARVCLEKNIPVYTVGSHSYIIQKLEKDFPYHQINHTLFSEDKKLTPEQLELAKQKLTSRFEGKIDGATSYMKESSFSAKPFNEELKKLFAKQKRNIIIYVHDFYDSPHVNKMLQFPDLYQFLKQTLEALKNLEDTGVFIKTHPNGMPGCKEKTIELVTAYNKSNFHIVDETISNLNIIQLKPDLIATARGTVCLEMAYFELPTVALFDNLYTNFSFTHTCFDKQSYFSILKGDTMPKNNYTKEHIYSFYYQAFLEKVVQKENNLIMQLASFKGNNSDAFLEFLVNGEYMQGRQLLVDYYSSALEKI